VTVGAATAARREPALAGVAGRHYPREYWKDLEDLPDYLLPLSPAGIEDPMPARASAALLLLFVSLLVSCDGESYAEVIAEGRFLNSESGAPIVGATAELLHTHALDWIPLDSALTDADGRVELRGEVPGSRCTFVGGGGDRSIGYVRIIDPPDVYAHPVEGVYPPIHCGSNDFGDVLMVPFAEEDPAP
jgi:hypothetical protein